MNTIIELIMKAKNYYFQEGNSVGGNLHIILNDGNIENSDIQYCLKLCKEKNDLLGIELSELLLKASKTQRKKLINSYSKYA